MTKHSKLPVEKQGITSTHEDAASHDHLNTKPYVASQYVANLAQKTPEKFKVTQSAKDLGKKAVYGWAAFQKESEKQVEKGRSSNSETDLLNNSDVSKQTPTDKLEINFDNSGNRSVKAVPWVKPCENVLTVTDKLVDSIQECNLAARCTDVHRDENEDLLLIPEEVKEDESPTDVDNTDPKPVESTCDTSVVEKAQLCDPQTEQLCSQVKELCSVEQKNDPDPVQGSMNVTKVLSDKYAEECVPVGSPVVQTCTSSEAVEPTKESCTGMSDTSRKNSVTEVEQTSREEEDAGHTADCAGEIRSESPSQNKVLLQKSAGITSRCDSVDAILSSIDKFLETDKKSEGSKCISICDSTTLDLNIDANSLSDQTEVLSLVTADYHKLCDIDENADISTSKCEEAINKEPQSETMKSAETVKQREESEAQETEACGDQAAYSSMVVDDDDEPLDNEVSALMAHGIEANPCSEFSQDGENQRPDDQGDSFLEDSLYYDTKVDLEDSDDEDLMEMPAGLNADAAEKSPSTPLKQQPDTSTTQSPELHQDGSPEIDGGLTIYSRNLKNKPSLDALLELQVQKVKENYELERIEEELKAGLEAGGVVQYSLPKVENDLLPEHEQQLKKLELWEQQIQPHHPGEFIFDPAFYLQLFSYPDTLTLHSCGFIPGENIIDKQLTTLSPSMLLELLTSQVIPLCFHVISTPHAFLTWLFYLLSIHPNCHVTQGAYHILCTILQRKSGAGSDWIPSCKHLAAIFVNYGASFVDLGCDPIPLTEADLRLKRDAGEAAQLHAPPGEGYEIKNLRAVFGVLTVAVTQKWKLYSSDELEALVVMITKAALDKQLRYEDVKFDVQCCLSALLNAFSEDTWNQKLPLLVQRLQSLTAFHHNQVYVVQLVPGVMDRGIVLQRALSYACLHHLLFEGPVPREQQLTNIKVAQLFPVLNALPTKDATDYYFIASLINLLDFCIGREPLPASERNDLRRLTDMLRTVSGEVREYIHILDRSTVKDMMVRLTSKWTFMLQNMGTRQMSIFECMGSQSSQDEAAVEPVAYRTESDSEDEGELARSETVSMETDDRDETDGEWLMESQLPSAAASHVPDDGSEKSSPSQHPQ